MEDGHKGIRNGDTSTDLQQALSALIENLMKPECLKRELIFALLLTVMEEDEFVLLKDTGETADKYEYLLNKKPATYEATLMLRNYRNLPLKLIGCDLNDIFLIVATIPRLYEKSYSVCFNINEHIKTGKYGLINDFENLDAMFLNFKEKIVIPMKSTILNYHSFPSGNLTGLPDDVFHQIILLLPVKDVLNLSESCKRIHGLVKEDRIWARLYTRDFPDKNKCDAEDWRDAYKDVYAPKQVGRVQLDKNVLRESFQEFGGLPDPLRVFDSRMELLL
ncbi:uncharacterized protein LOC101743455 [Bombyx mori]|uniref:F-box domain-containing protein n=1 Tax=Bombyx mori TaxID=7091 RepID=A0A8R1WHV8_BOMMO|nr:uncharacterized protein LOC101743455 [Bombyx mori]